VKVAMPIALSCCCGRALKVKDELANKKIRCPECKDILMVPAKDHVDELEVIPDDEHEEATDRGPRRAAIQADPPEVTPARRRTIEDDEPPRKKRPKPQREIRRRAPLVAFEEGWFGSVNAGVAGGVLMMLIAVVWLVVGLACGRIFFYPPILFVIGIVAIVKGGLGDS
jgi:hypothetical protein